MRLRPLMLVLVWLVALALPSGATASRQIYFPRHGHHCHSQYKRVVRHRHGRRRIACVKRRHSARVGRVNLHAHLDPTYTRDPEHPLKVTYAYSASATQEPLSAATMDSHSTEEPAPLPSGVLALYSDGRLECAVNVGGDVTGSECPVTYGELGAHKVTTIYTSGEESATATEVETIEPYPTSVTVNVSFSPLAKPEATKESWYRIGTVTLKPESTPAAAFAELRCPDDSGIGRITPLGCIVFPCCGGAMTFDVFKWSSGFGSCADSEGSPMKIDGVELESAKLEASEYSVGAEIKQQLPEMPIQNYGYAASAGTVPLTFNTGACIE